MTAGELLEKILPRLAVTPQTATFLDSLQATVEIVARRLWLKGSDLLRVDLEADVKAGENEVVLPCGFLGFASLPWAIYGGRRRTLPPLPGGLKGTFSGQAPPKYHELIGPIVTLYPATDAALTFVAEIYARPSLIESLDDNLPFRGVFDQLFIDAVTRVGKEGMILTVSPVFEAYLYRQVDQIVHHRPAKHITFRHPA